MGPPTGGGAIFVLTWTCNRPCRTRSNYRIYTECDNNSIHRYGICRTWLRDARSWWWLFMGSGRVTKTKCFHKRMDGMFAHIVAGSLYAVGFESFTFSLLKMINIVEIILFLDIYLLTNSYSVISITAFTYINIRGTSETSKAGNMVTIVQLKRLPH